MVVVASLQAISLIGGGLRLRRRLSAKLGGIQTPTMISTVTVRSKTYRNFTVVKGSSAPGGLYSAKQFELTQDNVDMVLDDVRPYLIQDGGNVDVVSVEDGVISLKLIGACGSCPSSTTTMKMGIERVLKEKFGDAVKDIRQVNDDDDQEAAGTNAVEAVNRHLDILRPAIKNYGGNVEVLSIQDDNCVVKYVGPDSIGSGIKAAIKERFSHIKNVTFTT